MIEGTCMMRRSRPQKGWPRPPRTRTWGANGSPDRSPPGQAAWRVGVAIFAVALVLVSCVYAADAHSDQLGQHALYVDPQTSAARALVDYPATAPEIAQIASRPQAAWLDDSTPTAAVAGSVGDYVRRAAQANATPIIVTYAIPHRDCGAYAAGGFASGAEYLQWIRGVAAGIGNAPAATIIEPDGLTNTGCLDSAAKKERTQLIKGAVDVLTADPNNDVYIDGGHSRWLSAADLANGLRAVDVDRARGFSLNVANFFTTAEEEAYGEAVATLLGDAHYVIDTSRNGNGPAPDGPMNWCNPQGRALGAAPTSQTSAPHADAYLWVKHPGESDGPCGRGEPRSGAWWNDYAVGLVRNARR
jgi:endoglucanase